LAPGARTLGTPFRSRPTHYWLLERMLVRLLPVRRLSNLCKLLGCPCYGTKETLVVRLLAQRALRLKLATFADNPAEFAASMRRESLRDMCREAGIWRSGNKRALAAGLINWRDRCRARGKAFLTELQSVSKSRPQQLTLRF